MWVGIDPSLTGTAIAIVDEAGQITTARFATAGTAKPAHADTLARLDRIERWIVRQLEVLGRVDLRIGMEGPSLSPHRTGFDHERAGLWWRLYTRASLYADDQVVVIAPTQRAKYATGKGNAGKDAVLLGFVRRFPDFTGTTNDEVDAAVIATMLARMDGNPVDGKIPAPCLAALPAKVAS